MRWIRAKRIYLFDAAQLTQIFNIFIMFFTCVSRIHLKYKAAYDIPKRDKQDIPHCRAHFCI